MRELTSIERGVISDALVDRIKNLESIATDLKNFHLNGSFIFHEIECHNDIVKLMKER